MRPIVTLAPLITIVAALSLSGVRQSDAGQPSLYVCNGESPQGLRLQSRLDPGPRLFCLLLFKLAATNGCLFLRRRPV